MTSIRFVFGGNKCSRTRRNLPFTVIVLLLACTLVSSVGNTLADVTSSQFHESLGPEYS